MQYGCLSPESSLLSLEYTHHSRELDSRLLKISNLLPECVQVHTHTRQEFAKRALSSQRPGLTPRLSAQSKTTFICARHLEAKKDKIWDILTLTVGQRIRLRILVAAEALAGFLGKFEYWKT